MTRASTVAFTPRNRLSAILSGSGLRTFAEHVASAEEAIEAVTPTLVERLEDDVSALAGLCRQEEDALFGQCREIGLLALTIVEIARLAGRPALALAARGVWEMIDALTARGVWHTDALRLHADALGTLIAAKDGPEGLAVAEELARMRVALGATAAS